MSRKLVICAVAALLFGCQATPTGGQRMGATVNCTTPQCQIDVAVSDGNPPVISVDVETLTIARPSRNVKIHWHLRNNDYEFKNDSIQFYDPAAARQFDEPGVEGSGAQFHYTDKNTVGGRFGYQIKVYNKRTGVWTTLDPAIFNDCC